MSERKTVRESSEIETDVPFEAFLKELNAAFESIPAELRTTANVELENGDYGDYQKFVLYHCRPETDEEMYRRENRHQLFLDNTKKSRQQQYETLKAEFEKETN